MGEMWMGIWIFTLIGLFIIAVAIYDYFDRKKRNQEIKLWKYLLAVASTFAPLKKAREKRDWHL